MGSKRPDRRGFLKGSAALAGGLTLGAVEPLAGMADRPLTFTMENLKRLPSMTRLDFTECAGSRSSRNAKTVQEIS